MANSQSSVKKKKLNYNFKVNKVHVQECGFYEDSSSWYILLVILITIIVGVLNANHVSTLFENDRHFSHLSNVEREMTFRTEMGLYYSYFKTIIEANSLSEGAQMLYRNNLTEYPLVINTLKRFNLYPELLIGAMYRGLNNFGILKQQCWTVNRGEGLDPVQSCEGLQDPPNFYISIVWITAGFTTSLMFLIGHYISRSVFGGLLAVLCFFYNHGEATRVMWTPPLRESFAFPICLAQVLSVTIASRNPRPGWKNVLSVSFSTTLFIVCWQFAQFMLFTQTCAVFAVYLLGVLPLDSMHSILVAQVIGLLNAVALMFGNEMLFTSWFFSSLIALFLITLPFNSIYQKLSTLPRVLASGISFLVLTYLLKAGISSAFNVQDDAHIFEILKSKFTDFKNFHTLLYTCAVEFDFLGWEMPWKTSVTLLLPSAVLATVLVIYQYLFTIWKKYWSSDSSIVILSSDPASLYNVLQMLAYALMSILIMRLKLFFTPHLCLVAGLLAARKYVSVFKSREIQLACLVALVAAMSYQGIQNIQEQRQIMGEYQNVALEELIEWINKNLPKNAVLAGPMPTMANLLLSTRRPIVNHPHYEDVGIRDRTKKVYTVFSRMSKEEVHRNLASLKVEYLILHAGWCLSVERNGCALTEVWDQEDPGLKNIGKEPLCPQLWHKTPLPFVKLFKNNEYAVLRVSNKHIEISSKTNSQTM